VSAAWELELGRLPDAHVAALAGVSRVKIREIRRALGIGSCGRLESRQREARILDYLRWVPRGEHRAACDIADALGLPPRPVRFALLRLLKAGRVARRAGHLHCWRLAKESR
jgi:hypothetical protein